MLPSGEWVGTATWRRFGVAPGVYLKFVAFLGR